MKEKCGLLGRVDSKCKYLVFYSTTVRITMVNIHENTDVHDVSQSVWKYGDIFFFFGHGPVLLRSKEQTS